MANYRIPWKRFAMLATVVFAVYGCAPTAPADQAGSKQTESLRLYVFDCGTLHYDNADAYRLKKGEVARTDMSLACFLVTHPKGTLMWDVGAVADGGWSPTGSPVPMHIVLPDKADKVLLPPVTLKNAPVITGTATSIGVMSVLGMVEVT